MCVYSLVVLAPGRGEGHSQKNWVWGVRTCFKNPYPIYDQNLQYSLPYLWPKSVIFPTLFMTWPKLWNPVYDLFQSCITIILRYCNIIWEGPLLIFFSIMMKMWLKISTQRGLSYARQRAASSNLDFCLVPSAFHFKYQRSRGRYCHLFILHMVFDPYMGLS